MKAASSHTLCAIRYDEPRQIEHIYSQIAKYLKHGHIVAYISDADTNSLLYCLRKQNIAVEDCVEKGALVLYGRSALYHDIFLSSKKKGNANEPLQDRIRKMLRQVVRQYFDDDAHRRKGKNKAGAHNGNNAHVLIINPVSAFMHTGQNSRTAADNYIGDNWLNRFEHELDKSTDRSIDLVCFYDESSLNSASLKNLLHILNVHQNTLHSGWLQSEWQADRIVDTIVDSIDKSLGAGTGRLVLNTMKLVYKINTEDVLNKPDEFEDILRRILGDAATKVIPSVKEDIVLQMRFDSRLQTV